MKWLLLALAWVALAVGGEVRPGRTAQLNAPEVAYRLRVLGNGLRVYSLVDRSQPSVAVQVWYGVGGRDDPPGRSGFAHLIEHLMFRGARGMPADFISRLTEDVGGENNASTDSDYTEYDDLSPAERLPQLLWAEARRMGSLVVDEGGFRAERAVVEQELQQEVLSDPYGPLFEFAIPKAGFATPAYGHSPIGSVADLEAATLAEAQAFHARYYRPDNAVLIVVGDFDEAQLQAWTDRYFGPIRRPSDPLPRPARQDPAWSARKAIDAAGDGAPDPAVVLCFAAPPAGGRDAAALKVLDAMLTGSRTSRLYASLVRDRSLASDVFSDADLRQRSGMIDVGAMMSQGARLGDGETALAAAIGDLRERPAPEAEIEAARNRLIVQVLQERETIGGLASQIGHAVLVEGGAAHVNRDLAALWAVTPADVQRVANRYLADDRRVTLRYHPAEGALPSAVGPARPPSRHEAASSEHLEAPASQAPPDLPPPAGAPAPTPGPAPVERVLANGLRVVAVRTGKLPLATALIRFRGGSALDPPGKAGLTAMTASLGAQGAGGHTAAAIAAAIAGLGESYAAHVDADSTTVRLSGLSNLTGALPILADIVRRPRFDQAAVRRMRLRMREAAAQAPEDADALADLAVARLVFGRGPYGRPPEGAPASLDRITREDVAWQYERIYRPDNAVLVVAGDLDPGAVLALAERMFGDWARPAAPLPVQPAEPAALAGRVVLLDAPGVQEATVMVAGRSIRRLDRSYYAVEVANSILGGGFSSRLNEEIRVRQGLTYDAASDVDERSDGGLFSATAQGDASAAPEIARLMLEQLRSIGSRPPSPDELAARKAALIGQAMAVGQTGADLADRLADDELYGRGLGGLRSYLDGVASITSDEVTAAASRLCEPDYTNILVIGDKDRVARELRRLFGKIKIISPDQVSEGRLP